MSITELLLIALGLSMDAFAVSVGKGLTLRKVRPADMLTCGIWFGAFQALMPVIGYFAGSAAAEIVAEYDHWVAFLLLALIGGNMIREALAERREAKNAAAAGASGAEDGRCPDPAEEPSAMRPGEMALLAVATSIDALAVGVSFAFLKVKIVPSALLIGVVTFCLSAAGVKAGQLFGQKYKAGAEIAGGVILILIGCKILLQDLGVL